MTCSKISRTWFVSSLSIRILEQPITDFSDWLSNIIMTQDSNTIIQTAALIYHIWFARNLMVFEEKFLPEEDIVRQAENITKEFTNAQLQVVDSSNTRPSTNTNRMQSTSRKWSKPEPDILKAKSDANLNHLGTWGLGSIIRDEHGMVMASATWRYGGFDCVTTAEAFPILSTMKLVQQCGFRRMMFESDNEKVIKLLQHKDVFHRSYLGSMFREMLKLGSL
jgi:hypothetical protein